MYKVILTLVALAPLALAGAPGLRRKKSLRPDPALAQVSRHANAVAELARAMREAEALPAPRPRVQLRLVAANG
jgi:hypothetical protein